MAASGEFAVQLCVMITAKYTLCSCEVWRKVTVSEGQKFEKNRVWSARQSACRAERRDLDGQEGPALAMVDPSGDDGRLIRGGNEEDLG